MARLKIRTRERLADVMRTVNPTVIGKTVTRHFHRAARAVEKAKQDNIVLWHMSGIAERHQSPHIRDLAVEASTYMVLDGLEG